MDRKKQRLYRGAHPTRYQADVESIVTSQRSHSIQAPSIAGHRALSIKGSQPALSGASSQKSTSAQLRAMSTRASDRLVEAHKKSHIGWMSNGRGKHDLQDILSENEMYQDVVDRINRKLALRKAIDSANDAMSNSRRPSELASRATGSNAGSIFDRKNRLQARADELDNASKHPSENSKPPSLQQLSQKGMNQSENKLLVITRL